MSRSVKGSKGCGYDFWGKRAMSQCGHGRVVKKLTLGIERMRERQMIRDELQLLVSDNDESYDACETALSRAV